ncbi:MAG: DUF3866 family protein [Firmicutes bacterium]|nr:DUF3866 family protein [Bacillota bacterium]
MIWWRKGRITRILRSEPELQEVEVELEGGSGRAWNYPALTGEAHPGDEVYLNTTAVELGLGSGGYHCVIANLTRLPPDPPRAGHIMKLRYTPYQLKVLSAEEEASPCRSAVTGFTSLAGAPVIVGTLHSLLAPAAAGCRAAAGEELRIVYVMTDGAALPIFLSETVRILKRAGLLAGTVTVGHAFGGDLEAVNIYSGLIAAAGALRADVIIVTMGPGIVGTGTKWGTTALEQGEVVNAVNILGGKAIAIPRLSFADARPRHRGVSHHTLTALGRVALTPALVALPDLPPAELAAVKQQLEVGGVLERHQVLVRDGEPALKYLAERGIQVRSMGRGPDEDPALFLAAGAAGRIAAEFIQNRRESQ